MSCNGEDLTGDRFEIRIPVRWRELGLIRDFLGLLVRQHPEAGFTPAEVEELKLAVQEACMNAIRHARPRLALGLRVAFLLQPDRLVIEVHDGGPGFDPALVPEPNLESLQEGGYGVFIMRRSMDSVDGRRTAEGFALRLTRLFRTKDAVTEER